MLWLYHMPDAHRESMVEFAYQVATHNALYDAEVIEAVFLEMENDRSTLLKGGIQTLAERLPRYSDVPSNIAEILYSNRSHIYQ